MTGANYMGGKRNAARTRTRDSTSRLQKRHFGQQRLATALCKAREEIEEPKKMTLKSALHEINLAPAQRDAKIKGSFPSTTASCNTSFAHKSSADIPKRRKRPSKILRALDSSDPLFYREAIDRILSIPLSEMIGLPVQEKSSNARDEGSKFDSDKEESFPFVDDDSESDVQVQETSSDINAQIVRSSTSTSHVFSLDNDDALEEAEFYDVCRENVHPASPEQRTVARHSSLMWSSEGGDLQGSDVNDSDNADMDPAETGIVRGPILTTNLLHPQRHTSSPSNGFLFPSCSGSQGTKEYILDMDMSLPFSPGSVECSMLFDTSPAAKSHGGSSHDPLSSDSAFPLGSPALIMKQNSPELLRWGGSLRSRSSQASTSGSSEKLRSISQSLSHPTDVKPSSASSFDTRDTSNVPVTPKKIQKMNDSPSCATQTRERQALKSFAAMSDTQDGGIFHLSHPAIQTVQVEDYYSSSVDSKYDCSFFGSSEIHDPGLPLDIINDPDPWATIGKIMSLENADERNNDEVHLTGGREGVGYVRPRWDEMVQECALQRSSKISPWLTRSVGEDEPQAKRNDEAEENTNQGYFVRNQPRHAEDSKLEERPSTDYYSTLVKDANSSEQSQPLCTPTVTESEIKTKSPWNSAALAHRVSPRAVRSGVNEDELCEGPCLFWDSDEDDDE